jgi:arylsulfatase A-like enzyme
MKQNQFFNQLLHFNSMIKYLNLLGAKCKLFIFIDVVLSFIPGIVRAQNEKPNIVLVLIDDLGYGELASYGNTFNETPNITNMAQEGMTFTNAYASAPVCSPSRASIHTGQYTPRHGIFDYLSENSSNYLDPSLHTTLSEALSGAGYYTGLIGKWHLDTDFENTPGSPEAHGFDWVKGTETKYIAGGDYFYPYDKISTITEGTTNEFLTDRLFSEANQFIQNNKDQAFFLSVQLYSVHMTLEAPPDLVEKYKTKYENKYGEGSASYFDSSSPRHAGTPDNPYMAAMLERIDNGIGSIRQTLEQLNLDENTIIIVTSDNGGDEYVANNGELRAAKTWLYEGGIKIPLIICFPGKCIAGGINETPVNFIDFYPTFLDLADATSNQILDGVSMVPLFTNQNIDRDELFWYYPAGAKTWNDRKACVVRKSDYKLIYRYALAPDYYELYNLKDDPGEVLNIYNTEVEKATELVKILDNWMLEMNLPKWELGEDTIFDFESEFFADYGTRGNLIGPPNTANDQEDPDHFYFKKVDNPFVNDLNPSETVGKFTRIKTGYWWAYAWFEFDPVYISATETTPKYIHVLIRKPIQSKVCIQLKGGNNAVSPEIVGKNLKINEWEDMVFEISTPGLFSNLEFKADFENSANPPYPERLTEDMEIFFDDIIVNDDPKPRVEQINEFTEKTIQNFETVFFNRWGTNGNGDGLVEDHDAFNIIPNNLIAEPNLSNGIGAFKRKMDGNWWAYAWFEFDTIRIFNVPVYLHTLINKPLISTVCIQLKDKHSSPISNTGEIKNENQTQINKWQDLVFKINTPGDYSYLEFKPDFINEDPSARLTSDIDIFFDDIIINTNPTPRNLELSAKNISDKKKLKIYPSLTTGLVNIESEDYNSLNLWLYDLSGKVLENILIKPESFMLDISKYRAGIYILKISSLEDILTYKIIKI